MIRVLLYFALLAALAAGGAWLADRPGDITIVWQGWRLETSVMVGAITLLAVVVAIMLLWSLLRMILRSPGLFSGMMRGRRRDKGYRALSKGLLAIGSGDAVAARRHARDAGRLIPNEPLNLLLSAQAAQLSGDHTRAESAFRQMLERQDTRLLGLRGLHVEAQRTGKLDEARGFAEAAAAEAPALGWAGDAMLEHQCATSDWSGALVTLDRQARHGAIDKISHARAKAVLLTARAQALEETDPDTARAVAVDAARLAPGLVPAAVLAGRMLAANGDNRKASKILEAAWTESPHPDIAAVHAGIKAADSARERLKRVQSLVKDNADQLESRIAVARAALAAKEFSLARSQLEPLTETPTRRVAALMAATEYAENGDTGLAREWMSRAARALPDPTWTADGIVSEHWLPVSPVSGRLDAFAWKVPVERVGDEPTIDLPVIEPKAPEVAEPPPVLVADATSPAQGAPEPSSATSANVFPLVHAPDDPGPDETAPPRKRWSLFG